MTQNATMPMAHCAPTSVSPDVIRSGVTAAANGADEQTVDWLLLIYRFPARKSRERVAVERELRVLGAQSVQRGSVLIPYGAAARSVLELMRCAILRQGGTAVVLRSTMIAGQAQLLAMMQAADAGSAQA